MSNIHHVLVFFVLVSSLSVSVATGTPSVQPNSRTSTVAGCKPHQSLSVRHREKLFGAALAQQPTISSSPKEQDPRIVESDKLIQSAGVLIQQEKVEEALVNLTKASELNPNDFRPHILSGLVFMHQLKFKSASEAMAKAIQLRPQSKELYVLKATADVRRSATEEALAASRKALEIDSNYAEAYAVIGESLRWDEKRRAESIEAYRKAIKINPSLLGAYDHLGQILEAGKEEKSAEEVFRQGIAADPNHMSGRFALGRMLVKQGRLVEARELWDGRTSDVDNTMPKFIELLKRAENLKRATNALAQKPKDPAALVEMGLAVMEGDHWVVDGRQKRAIVYFKDALKLKRNYARAQYGIVKAYIQFADSTKSEKRTLDKELGKLRQLDAALAKELEEYRKNYVSGIVGTPVKLDQ
jgi:tetratricopeptide (TPR) repeat protein